MAHKKDSFGFPPKPPTLAPSSSTGPPPSENLKKIINSECDRAFEFVGAGNQSKALKVIDKCISCYPDIPLLYNTRGSIFHATAYGADDSTLKLKHLKNAVESYKQAIAMSPNTVSFRLFNARALLELADMDAGVVYKDVIQECELALQIEDPVDPQDELLEVNSSESDGRIEKAKIEIRHLMEETQKRIVVGDGEIKQLLDASFLTEIRKEIEALDQRKKQIIESRPVNFPMLTEFSPRDDRFGEKKKLKNHKKLVPKVGATARVRDYWKNSMTVENKRELLKIGIEEFKAHFDKNKLAKAVSLEAIDFAKAAKKWRFWTCCCCGDRFPDHNAHAKHIKNEHLGTLPDNLMPQVISEETVGDVVWKPVDSISAVRIMENMSIADKGLKDSKIDKWPYCDDRERAGIIERIRSELQRLVRLKCFAPSHLQMLMRLIMSMLLKRIPKSQILFHGMQRELLSICFLEVSELHRVLECLENLATACAFSYLPESHSNDAVGDQVGYFIREAIVFSRDFSCLLFDERLLLGDIDVPDDGTAVTSAAAEDCDKDEAELPAFGDQFVFWLWMEAPTIAEYLNAWRSQEETSKRQGMEIFNILETEFHRLLSIFERKRELKRWKEPLDNVKNTCIVEFKKRREISGYDPQSSVSLLLKRQKELETEADDQTEGSSFELSIIRSILKEAESDKDAEWEILKQENQYVKQICSLDGLILVTDATMHQTLLRLVKLSFHDYRFVMVPLLKSFVQAHLKNLVDKDAEEKSNAATEALLQELALDAEETNKGGANGRQGRKKSKDKKKIYQKNAMNSKASITGIDAMGTVGERHLLLQEEVEQACRPAAHGGNYTKPGIGFPGSTDELNQQEEELRAEFEEAERKLEETLVLQRRMENEAKQKRLAEQNDNVENYVPGSASEPGEDVGSIEEQQPKQPGPVPLPLSGICFGKLNWEEFARDQEVKSDSKSGKLLQQRQPGRQFGPVPLPDSGICFGNLNWTEFIRAHSDKSDKESSEFEQLQHSEAPEAE